MTGHVIREGQMYASAPDREGAIREVVVTDVGGIYVGIRNTHFPHRPRSARKESFHNNPHRKTGYILIKDVPERKEWGNTSG